MNKLFIIFLLLVGLDANSQTDEFVKLTIKTGGCHGVKAGEVTLYAKRSVLKKFIQKEAIHLDNCSYLLQSADDIVAKGKPVDNTTGGGDGGDHITVKDPGEFIELYKDSKKGQATGELCIDSNGKVSFSIGTEEGSIEISSSGSFAISVKSPSGVTHKAEF